MTLAEAVPSDEHGRVEPADSAHATPAPQAEAVVDLDAIAHNVGILREKAGDAAVMAVVKADGYNHGAVPVARAALAAGAAELGVTTVSEALTLRRAGIGAPILAWLHTVDADFAPAIRADVELGVSSPRHLASVVAAAREVGTPATVTIKVDTGLNRNGVAPDELAQVLIDLARAQAEGAVRLRGIFSHLAHADEPHHAVIDAQCHRLSSAVADAKRHGLVPEVVHLSNSAATLTRPDLRFDMVRPGIAIYGLSPAPELGEFGLRPAMTLRSRVALVKKVAAGEGVSYGHQWIAPRNTVVALLPFGYADGLPRSLSGRFEVLLGSERRPGIGRVCMDQVVVDLGPDGGGVREGDTAVFFGNGDHGEPHAQEWADKLDTIHYEVVTGVRGRTVRTYVGGR
ncbi:MULTISPECIES: alanine racemase [Rhodococcus]|uniref:Alanine racemase n=1 Tax=Rhodococcus oxybenzonivorans TaxID=1990687 RepID=A0AAE5A465_9NOCA|nr:MULTISPECIES: alanine racemase [Rhodococcus]MDV7245486.1 alanine racemase [Rhodococcus oxybenzonivorans]MDV7263287.1 alanine racemase [Rhodococcus oxybenzonivorans]MDV7276566.1 alanine racemase [Rhodococcus oxybenzonivorans]MDV7336507.1 alanine racemase [Rhodococcus oxybenzonivorans]MDV7346838.1 alanine racemase [Rhodococcus oxybenzonivorans]